MILNFKRQVSLNIALRAMLSVHMKTLPNVATLKCNEYFEADFKPFPLKQGAASLFWILFLVVL